MLDGMRLIGYLRVSTEQQTEGYGLDAQRASIEAWASREGHTISAWFADVASGTIGWDKREQLTAALDALRPPPQARGLVVARLDRLARTLTVQEACLAVAWQAGATVYSADAGEVLADDPDDPMRTAIRQVMGAFAQMDRALIAKRMRDGRKAKAAAGRHAVGSYAYGLHGVGDGRDRDAGPHPTEQVAVARIVALRAQGKSYREIAAALDAEGHRPRRAASWSAMSVRSVALRATA